jgi:hypothetical protein
MTLLSLSILEIIRKMSLTLQYFIQRVYLNNHECEHLTDRIQTTNIKFQLIIFDVCQQ